MEVSIVEQINAIMNGIKEIDGKGLASCTVTGNWALPNEEDKEANVRITYELRSREMMDWMHFVCNVLPYIVISVIAIVIGCCFTGKQHDADFQKDGDVMRVRNIEASTSVRIGADKGK